MAKQQNKGTSIWSLHDLLRQANEVRCRLPDSDQWIPCRPFGWTTIAYRLSAMKLVWQGKADVVVWPGEQ